MGFLDIGLLEVLLILVIALIIFGPGKIPEIARKLGAIVRTLKKASYDFTTAVTREINSEDKKPSPPLDKTPKNNQTKPRSQSDSSSYSSTSEKE